MPCSTVDRIEARYSDPRIGTFAKLLAAIGVEVVVCIGKQPIPIDAEREQLRDVLGRHFPPHWELEPVVWLDRWWGWWRKHPNVRMFPPQYHYWKRRPPDWDYLVARRWEDVT